MLYKYSHLNHILHNTFYCFILIYSIPLFYYIIPSQYVILFNSIILSIPYHYIIIYTYINGYIILLFSSLIILLYLFVQYHIYIYYLSIHTYIYNFHNTQQIVFLYSYSHISIYSEIRISIVISITIFCI